MKVNVWQVGYVSQKDCILDNRDKAACRPSGYVEVQPSQHWEEEVWDLLNWSCYTSKKPEQVHSPLDHCNADIILQIEGSDVFKYAQFVGFKDANSLEEAVEGINTGYETIWPFQDVPRIKGYAHTTDDGRVYISEKWDSPKETWVELI